MNTVSRCMAGLARVVRCRGQREAKKPARARLDPEAAAVRFDDGPADAQSEAHAVGLVGPSARKELRCSFGADAGTAVAHLDQHLADGSCGAHTHAPRPFAGAC